MLCEVEYFYLYPGTTTALLLRATSYRQLVTLLEGLYKGGKRLYEQSSSTCGLVSADGRDTGGGGKCGI